MGATHHTPGLLKPGFRERLEHQGGLTRCGTNNRQGGGNTYRDRDSLSGGRGTANYAWVPQLGERERFKSQCVEKWGINEWSTVWDPNPTQHDPGTATPEAQAG
jgi:hypothetical protein